MSTRLPTVAPPGGMCGAITAWAAFSSRVSTNGVANTVTPGLPRTSAVSSSVTTRSTSAVRPGSSGMVGLLYPVCRERSTTGEQEHLRPEQEQQDLDEPDEGALAHAIEETPARERADDHDHPEEESDGHRLAPHQLVTTEDHQPEGEGADGAERVGRDVGAAPQAMTEEERADDGAGRADQGGEEPEDSTHEGKVTEAHRDPAGEEPAAEWDREQQEGAEHPADRGPGRAREEGRPHDGHRQRAGQ